MKKVFCIFFFVFACIPAQSQYDIDSLRAELRAVSNDTLKLVLNGQLTDAYAEINPDSAYHYADNMLALSKKVKLRMEESNALGYKGYALINLGNYPRSLQLLLEALAIAEDPSSQKNVLPPKFPETDEFYDRSSTVSAQRHSRSGRILQWLGVLYINIGNYKKAIDYLKQAISDAKQAGSLHLQSISYSTLGRAYIAMKEFDSAKTYLQLAYDKAYDGHFPRYYGTILLNMGRVYMGKKQPETAKQYLRIALQKSNEGHYYRGVAVSYLLLAELYKQEGRDDSTLYFLTNALNWGRHLNAPDILVRDYTALANFYASKGNNDSIVKYQTPIIKLTDSIFNAKQALQFQNIDFDEEQKVQKIEAAKAAYENKVRLYALSAGAIVFLVATFVLYRNNRLKQKTNFLLAEEKNKVERTLQELKSTQMQLIQSEKMASLGELSAGIAHEIQNPLNFVNNFSDLGRELLVELNTAIENDKYDEVKEIAADLAINQEKIYNHGKRAETIVKGMLYHSRNKTGEMALTDVNELAGEYLRLAYNASVKDKEQTETQSSILEKQVSQPIAVKTNFDQRINKVKIIPRDIGIALLNIYNNAFYSVFAAAKEREEKSFKTKEYTGMINDHALSPGILATSATVNKNDANPVYQPEVIVETKLVHRDTTPVSFEIRIKDNGTGIPENAVNKIFQPFFTTKPTGKGTGLGLSIAYDIINAHGGNINLVNEPGRGAEFVISLPLQ